MKIAVVGSINMDMTVTTERIPLSGETLKGESIQYNPGGKGANQAVAMAKLGAEVTLFGCVGNDSNGNKLLEHLACMGIKTDFIQILKNTPTGIALITVGEQDNTIVVVAGANDKVDLHYFKQIQNRLKTYDMIVLQHEIPLETVHAVILFCAEQNIPVILNPAPAMSVPQEIIEKVTYLTPNEHEAALIFGHTQSIESLLRKYPEKLIITQGEKGVSVCLKSGEIVTIPARTTQVVDTTGAGDTLNGAFCVKIAAGADVESALRYANVAASLSVEKFGAQSGMPTEDEVEKVLITESEKD